MNLSSEKGVLFGVAGLALLLDQITKTIVIQTLPFHGEKVILEGFFRFVHWGNTGAAWSMFPGQNFVLAGVSVVALIALYLLRANLGSDTVLGRVGLGLIYGGIVGNLIDRLLHHHVVDFIYFYVNRRGGGEIGFPAFNIADSAICTGVGIIFLLSWKTEEDTQTA